MKLIDLIYQLQQGRKIRRKKWPLEQYIRREDNSIILEWVYGEITPFTYNITEDIIEDTDDWKYYVPEEESKPRIIKFEAYLYEGYGHNKIDLNNPLDIAFGKCMDEKFHKSSTGYGDESEEWFSKWEVTLKELK